MKHKITESVTVDLQEKDDILRAVATRKASIDYGSMMHYLPNPDQVLKRRGVDISVYAELSTDPLVSAATGSFKDGVKELKWAIDRGKAKTRSAQLIERIFKDIDSTDEMGGMSRIIGEILDARMYGYQPLEVEWAKVGRYIVPVDIVAKPQEWFAFSPENVLLFRSKENPSGTPVPPFKFLCPTYEGSYKNPYGRAVLSSCFWPVTFKKGGFKFFVTFIEKYGSPWAVGKHNYTDQHSVDKFADDLDAMVQDGVIVVHRDEEIELIQPAGTQSTDGYNQLIGLCREEINYAILNHNAATSSTPGKLGNENGALEARSSVINSGKELVTQAMNVVIKWVYQLNGLTGEVPRFEMYQEEDVDLENAERDNKLYQNGVRFTRSYMRKTYGLEDDDFWLADNESGPPTGEPEPAPISLPPWVVGIIQKTAKPAEGASFAEGDHEDQKAVDDAVDKAIAPGNKILNAFAETVISFIESSNSYEDALKKIGKLYPKMPLKELEGELNRMFTAAAIMGAHTETHEH